MRYKSLLIFLVLMFVIGGCDIYVPNKKFRLVIPKTDYFYNYMSTHLKPFLEENGYEIELMTCSTALEANVIVARGDADLTFINNVSTSIADELGMQSSNLRTVMPLTTRLFIAYTKDKLPDSATAKELFENKRIGIEVLNGETHKNIETFLVRAKIKNSQIVSVDDPHDVRFFWGTFYGKRSSQLLDEGWHPFPFKNNWIEFHTLNDPALHAFTLPAIPGDSNSIPINTIATETVLVTRKSMGENSIYELSQLIFKNKLALMHNDLMYRFIDESFDQQALLFPMHEGVAAYLRRDQPTFFERYSDALALVLSIVAVIYGAFQAVANRLARRRKEQIDMYFLEFLQIRSNKNIQKEEILLQLDNLFQRAVQQMTSEKLDKSDFHIFARLIQQEITILRSNS